MATNNNQFRAEAGKVYRNESTGQTVSYNEAQLKNNPAIGNLSGQFTEYRPDAERTISGATNVEKATDTTNQTLDQMTEGLVDPMELENVRQGSEFQQGKEAIMESADATFDPQILQTKTSGRGQVSSARGITGQSMGQNLSSAELSYIQNVQGKVDSQVKQLEQQKQAYINEGLFDLANSLNDRQVELMNAKNNLILQEANLALNLRGQEYQERQGDRSYEQSERQLDLSEIDLLMDIPKGETFTYKGQEYKGLAEPSADPFFSSSDIISLMKTIPAGTTETIVDPNTGREYSVTGFGDDNNIKLIESVDASGRLTISKYDIANERIVSQVDAGQVGRSGGSGTSVSLFMQGEQREGLEGAVSYLSSTKGSDGYYNSGAVASEMQKYAIQNPGKASQFWDAVKPFINPNDMPSLQAQKAELTGIEMIDEMF